MRVAAFRPHTVHWSASRPLMHSACPLTCLPLRSVPLRQASTLPRPGVIPSIEGGPACNPHRVLLPAGETLPATSRLGAFQPPAAPPRG